MSGHLLRADERIDSFHMIRPTPLRRNTVAGCDSAVENFEVIGGPNPPAIGLDQAPVHGACHRWAGRVVLYDGGHPALFGEFENFAIFKPGDHTVAASDTLRARWSRAAVRPRRGGRRVQTKELAS